MCIHEHPAQPKINENHDLKYLKSLKIRKKLGAKESSWVSVVPSSRTTSKYLRSFSFSSHCQFDPVLNLVPRRHPVPYLPDHRKLPEKKLMGEGRKKMQGIRRVITGISKARTFLVSLEDSHPLATLLSEMGTPQKSQNEYPLEVTIPMKNKDSNLLFSIPFPKTFV